MNKDEIEPAVELYVKATENDWRTVQTPASATQTNETSAATAETKELMNVARSILMNENGTIE